MPPTTNSMYKPFNGRFMVDASVREKKEAMAWEARSQYRGPLLEGDLEVYVWLTWPTKRNHDVDNIKSLLDSMKGILWVDDGQIVRLVTEKSYEKGTSRVDIRARKRQ